MAFIEVNSQNIQDEHICCAFSDKKCSEGYELKKEWLKGQFAGGGKFIKLDERAKVFIEYAPAEHVWLPLHADNYMYISCFWVSGKYKGHGYGKKLLKEVLSDAENKAGICVITSNKKRPFMNDPGFLKYNGFTKVDSAPPYFELWCLKNDAASPDPQFYDSAKIAEIDSDTLTVFYSNACPFTEYYVNHELKGFAIDKEIPLEIIKLNSKADADQLPVPWNIYSLFYQGKFLTHEIKSLKGLEKLIG